MISRAMPFLYSPREASQNLGWALAGGMGGNDGLNCVNANYNAAAVKPVLDVSTSRDPFQILSSAVRFVLVPMMNAIQPKWIRDKGVSYEPVNGDGSNDPVLGKLNLGVSIPVSAVKADISSGKSCLRLTHNVAAQTFDSAKAAYLVKILVVRNWFPLLPGLGSIIGGRDAIKKILNGGFHVKLFRPSVGALNAGHQVPIVAGNSEKLGLNGAFCSPAPMGRLPLNASNSVMVRKLVQSLKVRDWQPLFASVFRLVHMLLLSMSSRQGYDMANRMSCQPIVNRFYLDREKASRSDSYLGGIQVCLSH